MATTLLYIRHMVCSRCILVVREQLVDLGLVPLRVELGEVELRAEAHAIDWLRLRQSLADEGFELLDLLSPQQRLVIQIKTNIADLLHSDPAALRSGQFSRQLSTRLNRRFAYLSATFSITEGCGLEHYVIRQRIEAAQRLLLTSSLTVSRIARLLGYSSLGHLSGQFQRETGSSPSDYRRARGAMHFVGESGFQPEAGVNPWAPSD